MKVKLSGVHCITKKLANGTTKLFYYHRATRIRLDGEPGTAEFLQSFANAEKKVAGGKHQGTLVQLIREYTSSIEFNKLAKTSQLDYKRLLTAVEGKFGSLPIAALNDPEILHEFLKWRLACVAINGEKQADYRLCVISAMLSWAVQHGKVKYNHLKGFKHLYKSDRKDLIWTQADIDAFNSVACVELQNALTLALHTAQREGDLLRLKWSNYDGSCIRLQQGKTGARVVIPCTKELKRTLDRMEKRSIFILTTPHGRPFSKSRFLSLWREATERAGITIPRRERYSDHTACGSRLQRCRDSVDIRPHVALCR
jgi:integrase